MEFREDIEAIRTLGVRRFLYLRLIYIPHMRYLHDRGRHKMRHYGPMLPDGGEFDKCDWCGHVENFVPPPPDWDDLRGRAPDATGGLSTEAFVRELRDGWR